MKFLHYCKYFFFLAWNWNPSLAAFVIYHEIKGEKKYRIRTSGASDLGHLADKGIDVSHATMYMPLNYFVLEKLMTEINKYKHNKTFLDIGCGKGRIMAVAAHHGFTKITGIDFSKELCDAAIKNTNKTKVQFPNTIFTVVNNDAFYFDISKEITTICLFNPFDDVITSGVVSNILKSQRKNPRTIRVIYANPLYKSLFTEEGFTEIYHIKKLEYLEGSILEKKP